MTSLKKSGLLRTYYRDRLRGYRLGAKAKAALLDGWPEHFSSYLTGDTDTNRLKSEVNPVSYTHLSKSPVREEMSSTVYLLSNRTLVALLKVLAEPFTRRLRIWAIRVVSGAAFKISYRSPRTGISR